MEITHEDWRYFLDFVKDNSKKISYAASFGNSVFPKEDKEIASKFLKQIKSLSVREISGQKLVKEITNLEPEVVLDPTLLLNKDEWEKRTNFKPNLEHYILVYFPFNKKKVFNFVKKLSEKTQYPVVYLSISPRVQLGVKTIYDASPEEFLGWFKYADYVVTGSFHGTAFSLNMHKNFYYEPSGSGSRIDNIVKITETLNRSIDNENVLNEDIDFNKVEEKLEKQRKKSIDFLKGALDS